MLLSPPWWQSSSVLTQISTATTLLAFAGGIWAAFYASRPRRALTYSARMRQPREDEKANWVNNALHDAADQDRAAIVNFILRGSGRLDVPTSVFDNATPITITADATDAPIRSEVGFDHRRDGGHFPEHQVQGNQLTIRPGLIGRNQILVYTWITVPSEQLTRRWGRKAKFEMTSALIDTKLRPSRRNILIRLGVLAVAIALIAGLWYGWLGLASYLSTGETHSLLDNLASKPGVLIVLLPIPITIGQFWKRNRDSRRAKAQAAGQATQAQAQAAQAQAAQAQAAADQAAQAQAAAD